ncbi:hypothetical protein CC78DRAFT_562665 [Lojkania enalia]|uniref:Peptidase A1 domain-containing protein n=1 Tax=Lojkania enalia TaxID=147567 RepID=A0A9P4N241_9PLEO|nr:hypothetical protein CC78DRAFT_562665 [Didymosphaeria enalia]
MDVISSLVNLILVFGLFGTISSAQRNFEVPWSKEKYGPDGPWQAVTITLGGIDNNQFVDVQNHSKIDVYPGNDWEVLSFTDEACDPYPNSICGIGGFWEPDQDALAGLDIISWPYSYVDDSYGMNVQDAQRIYMGLTISGKTVYNASLVSARYGNITYPNGQVGGVPLGVLPLGGDKVAQYFITDSTTIGKNITAWTFPGRLYSDGDIPSFSYGLHIGSASFNYPGSLVYGGYNKGRVIGPVTSFKNASAVDLLDIGIGVEHGNSPFNFTSKQNLLVDNLGKTGQIVKVKPDPLQLYLALPGKTCEELANLLPVTFDQTTKYYLWNVNDPGFHRIVTSPTYLSFTFPPPPGDSDDVVIKVPFALLNLTLDHPITEKATQYFPCHAYDKPGALHHLGRAFLQAAFLGRNYETGYSWLAQAPGPGVSGAGLGDSNTDISRDAIMIEGFTDPGSFNRSWAGHWSVIDSPSAAKPPSSSASHNTPQSTALSSGGLSTGAIAGICVGAFFAAIAMIGFAVLLWRRRQRVNNHTCMTRKDKHDMKHLGAGIIAYEGEQVYEAPGSLLLPQEAPDTNDPRMK